MCEYLEFWARVPRATELALLGNALEMLIPGIAPHLLNQSLWSGVHNLQSNEFFRRF